MSDRNIGPLDGCLSFFTVFNWVFPALQHLRAVKQGVPRMLKGEPVDWYVQIHGADFPQAIVILQNHGVLSDSIFPNFDFMRKIHEPALYPLNAWKGIRVPNEKFGAIASAFDFAGIRYKV